MGKKQLQKMSAQVEVSNQIIAKFLCIEQGNATHERG